MIKILSREGYDAAMNEILYLMEADVLGEAPPNIQEGYKTRINELVAAIEEYEKDYELNQGKE